RSICPPINGEVVALDEPGLANLFEHGNGLGCLACTSPKQASDAIISPSLLRTRREWPSCGPSSNSFDEISTAHATLRSEVKGDASFQSLSNQSGNVRFGSKADTRIATPHVRFTPESGHVHRTSSCLFWAKSGHRPSIAVSAIRPKANTALILPWPKRIHPGSESGPPFWSFVAPSAFRT